MIQHRWIRGSEQNFGNEIWQGGRKKDAIGSCKSNIKSHLLMLDKHQNITEYDEVVVDLATFSVMYLDKDGPIYCCWYEAIENVETN